MAQSDDTKVPGEGPKPTASPSRFWQRYSGRDQAATDEPRADEDPISSREVPVDQLAGTSGRDAGETGSAGGTGTSEQGGFDPGDPRPRNPGPTPPGHSEGHQCLDWCPICRGAELLRDAVPPELQEQFKTVQRDALLLAQAMIEAHLERLKREAPDQDPDISSIPID